MGVLLKIVYRNLREHKVKTVIIGIIVAFGMFILITGNSIIDTITSGIRANFIEYNTGHIAIFPSSRENPSLTGGAGEAFEEEFIPAIGDYESVAQTILDQTYVDTINPQINGTARLQLDGEGSGFAQLIGVDPEKYREFFPGNLDMTAGRFLRDGEEGIVISAETVEMLEESSGKTVRIGDSVLLTATSTVSGMKIREVPVVGIFEANAASQIMTSYVDAGNMRVLAGLTRISDVEAVLSQEEKQSLGGVDEGELFGGEGDFITNESSAGVDTSTGSADEEGLSVTSMFSDTEERRRLNEIDPNAWHYLLVRLNDDAGIQRAVNDLNNLFAERNLEVTAYSWIDAAGQVAELTAAMRLVFNIIIFIIAVVAVIIIMNTLVISVTERIGEIGTMRAMGAQKSFVRRMIIFETLIIAGVFGGIGIIAGSATVGVFRALGLETQNMILQMLAGGEVIRPVLRAGSVIVSLIGMTVAGVVASLYPAALALRIEPRQAMETQR